MARLGQILCCFGFRHVNRNLDCGVGVFAEEMMRQHPLESYEQALDRINPSQRHEMRANAAFGNTSLIDHKHFATPRDSRLPWNYYHDPDRIWWKLTGFVAILLLLGIAATVMGLL
jgi:hypothetical protein